MHNICGDNLWLQNQQRKEKCIYLYVCVYVYIYIYIDRQYLGKSLQALKTLKARHRWFSFVTITSEIGADFARRDPLC